MNGPLDLPLWLERLDTFEEWRQDFTDANGLPEDWQPDPEDAAPWWQSPDL